MGVADTSGIYFIVLIFFQRQILYEDKFFLQLQLIYLHNLIYISLNDNMDQYPRHNGSSQDQFASNYMKFELH